MLSVSDFVALSPSIYSKVVIKMVCGHRWYRIKERKKKADSTLRSSRAVPHPSTNRALRRLTSEVRRDLVYSTRYGRQRESFHAGAHRVHVLLEGGGALSCPIDALHILAQALFDEKLTAPRGVPRRSPTPVLTRPLAA